MEYFQILEDYAYFQPLGEMAVKELLLLVMAAFTFAHTQQINRLLVDTTELKGLSEPTVMEQYNLGVQLARATKGLLRLALLVKHELLDSMIFTTSLAVNRGLTCEVFTSQQAALEWLMPSERGSEKQ